MTIDYYKIFVELDERRTELTKQQKMVEVELAKLTETIQPIFKMLTPAQQRKAQKVIERIEGPKGGLKQGVVMALRASTNDWLTPPQIRDYLKNIGFDFGASGSRGLASIGTTLKRMVPEEVETKAVSGGQMAYRLRGYSGIAVGDAVMTFLEDMQHLPASLHKPRSPGVSLLNEAPQRIDTPPSIENAFERSLRDKK
jgi:hypothetical protein